MYVRERGKDKQAQVVNFIFLRTSVPIGYARIKERVPLILPTCHTALVQNNLLASTVICVLQAIPIIQLVPQLRYKK
jgi:hypothetical protein